MNYDTVKKDFVFSPDDKFIHEQAECTTRRDHSVLLADGPSLGRPNALPLQLRELQKQLESSREERCAAEKSSTHAAAELERLRAEVEAVSQQVLDLDADLRASQVPAAS